MYLYIEDSTNIVYTAKRTRHMQLLKEQYTFAGIVYLLFQNLSSV